MQTFMNTAYLLIVLANVDHRVAFEVRDLHTPFAGELNESQPRAQPQYSHCTHLPVFGALAVFLHVWISRLWLIFGLFTTAPILYETVIGVVSAFA